MSVGNAKSGETSIFKRKKDPYDSGLLDLVIGVGLVRNSSPEWNTSIDTALSGEIKPATGKTTASLIEETLAIIHPGALGLAGVHSSVVILRQDMLLFEFV